jgi:hypothetical protein
MEQNVDGLEIKLAVILRPIKPRTEFVHSLGHRIRGLGQTIQAAGAGTWKFILLMLAGALSLGFLLALLGRFLFRLFEVRKKGSERV